MKKNSILNKIKIINIILVSILFVVTLFEIGLFSQGIYFINFAKKRIDELSKENEVLEDKLLDLSSISNLNQFLEKSEFVKAEKIKFIQILESGVVVK
jgi:hypothetical protein